MIISFKLLAYCLLAGGIYLLIVDLFWNRLERFVPTLRLFPSELVETQGIGWFIANFMMEFIFFIFLPSIIYGWFYTIFPFAGIRGGISIALYLIIMGAIPLAFIISFRIKLPLVFILYQLLGIFIKLTGTMAIIGYLYAL